ncbi:MAG: hypothetical protein DRG78_08495 [Epsilonproteobacteria bacterium]|nr:MAG: hypothetical protein DRG78_08495 [Campylobacterota bacterium]
MNIWKIDKVNNFKIISDTPNFKLFFMKDTNTTFTELTEIIDVGDNLYLSPHSFDAPGDYIIKLIDTNTNDVRYNQVNVLDENDFEFMKTGVRYSTKYDDAYLVFNEQ